MTVPGATDRAFTRAETHGLDPAIVLWDSWNERERGTADDVGAFRGPNPDRRSSAGITRQGRGPQVWLAEVPAIAASGESGQEVPNLQFLQ